MITKDNLNIYDDLYLRANLVLAKAYEDSRWKNAINTIYKSIFPEEGDYSADKKPISNINIYYSFLKILSEFEQIEMKKDLKSRINLEIAPGVFEKFQPIFTMLPFDEPRFKVNLNTRRIETPAGFIGQQVQNDNFAETIWFEVDRYFDAMDLYTTDISIQWENGNVKKVTQALNPTANLEIADLYGKIIFGWPLTKAMTHQSGTVKFSIRFQKRADNTVVYNLTTLPMNLRINDTLVFDDNDSEIEVLDTSENFYANMQYEHYYTVVPAAEPLIQFIGLVKNEAPDKTVRTSDLNGGSLILYAKGYVPGGTEGAGSIGYKWINYGENNEAPVVKEDSIRTDYIKSLDTSVNPNEIYYRKTASGDYEKADMTSISNPSASGDLYQRYSVFEASTAGRYGVEVLNWFGGDQKAYSSDLNKNTEIFIIPYAQAPIFSITENGRAQIEEGASKTITIPVKVEDGAEISQYVWYRTDNSTDNPEDSRDNIQTETSSLTLKNDDTFTEGYYWLKAVNSRNGDTTSAICPYYIRVTENVKAPIVIDVLVGKESWGDRTLIDLNGKGADSPIVLKMDNSIPRDEDFIFQWKFVNDENDRSKDEIISNKNELIIPKDGVSGTYACEITNTYNGKTAKTEIQRIIIAN